jgi:hypothetical protein
MCVWKKIEEGEERVEEGKGIDYQNEFSKLKFITLVDEEEENNVKDCSDAIDWDNGNQGEDKKERVTQLGPNGLVEGIKMIQNNRPQLSRKIGAPIDFLSC